jgi:hypothetical protein
MRICLKSVLAPVVISLVPLATFIAILPILSTRPSSRASEHWEKEYASLLPPNYGDFRAHWQSQDVGVRIFSFRCPTDMTGEQAVRHLVDRLPGFVTSDRRLNEVAVRRSVTYSDAEGFDEYRFVYRPREHRVYGLFANLDSEKAVHGELVKKLEELAGPDE